MRFYTDNPVRDADLHRAWLDEHYVPICERCGNPIESRVYDVICYGTVCEDCYEFLSADDDE